MSGTSSPVPAPDALELAALLCSRVCHDLISPVGAIVNGLEVLDDNPKPDDREFALDLIRKSAKTASARLTARMAAPAKITRSVKGSISAAAAAPSITGLDECASFIGRPHIQSVFPVGHLVLAACASAVYQASEHA